ncbi:MAG: DUF86 domain-containing protein [Patescibacteria group bacterium]
MEKNPKIFLEHILESIGAIEEYATDQTLATFLASSRDQDAVIRRFEIIGEAVKNLSDNFRNKYPKVPWNKMAGMRDVLVHEYFTVDIPAVWDTIQGDLPPLKNQLKEILSKENK